MEDGSDDEGFRFLGAQELPNIPAPVSSPSPPLENTFTRPREFIVGWQNAGVEDGRKYANPFESPGTQDQPPQLQRLMTGTGATALGLT